MAGSFLESLREPENSLWERWFGGMPVKGRRGTNDSGRVY